MISMREFLRRAAVALGSVVLCVVTTHAALFPVKLAAQDYSPYKSKTNFIKTPREVIRTQKAAAPEKPLAKKAALKINEHKQIWNLKNANIRAVIQTISLLTGKNFIVDPRVNGRISLISHEPMTPDELYHVFLSLLQVLNYSAISSGNVIKIVPSMDAKQYSTPLADRLHPGNGDEVVVRVVPVSNVSATQLVPALRPLMQQWGTVSAYAPSNSLILVGLASNIQRLVRIVHSMDKRNDSSISMVVLHHANASKVTQILEKLQRADRISGRVSNVSIAADSQNNSILISGTLQSRMMMRSLVRRLDSTSGKSAGNTIVVHLNYLDAKKLAPVLSKIAEGTLTEEKGKGATSASGSNNLVTVEAQENDNAVIIHGPVNILQSLKHVIQQLDVRPSEVLVQAIIVKVDQNFLNQLGIVWSTVDSSGNPTGTGNGNSVALQVSPGLGFINDGSLQAVVTALKQNGSTDILATPSVMVLNNESATIDDGKNIGIINRQYSTNVADQSNTTVPFNTIQRQNVTLSLKVTPTISPNQMLRLKIDQQDDSLDDSSSSDASDNPTIDTSKIQTSVLVKSGAILVLGGLSSNNVQKSLQKIPILGDLPLVGHLFRYKNHNYQKQDLMVFIRPVILNNNLKSKRVTIQRYNYTRQREIQARIDEPLSQYDMPMLPQIGKPHLQHLPLPTMEK